MPAATISAGRVMTDTQITNDGTGVSLRSAPDAVRHAYVENGQLRLLDCGRVIPASRWDAICALLAVEGSPYPSSQERARQIRAALKETMQ